MSIICNALIRNFLWVDGSISRHCTIIISYAGGLSLSSHDYGAVNRVRRMRYGKCMVKASATLGKKRKRRHKFLWTRWERPRRLNGELMSAANHSTGFNASSSLLPPWRFPLLLDCPFLLLDDGFIYFFFLFSFLFSFDSAFLFTDVFLDFPFPFIFLLPLFVLDSLSPRRFSVCIFSVMER